MDARSNEDILSQQTGHLGVRDKTQWEAINEKYVLASAAGRGAPNKRPDWRNLDLDALRGCAGLEGLEMPTWIHESQLADSERDHYQSLADNDDSDSVDSAEYHPPDDDAAPF